ncbi:MAG: hypothetical protein KJ626_03560 [Verrucomicrobia bacterium]|nr:hypothetical protein [Verrucomicrobiota bacterium]
MISKRHFILAVLVLAFTPVHADVGRIELSQSGMPYTLTNSGSYVLTENLTGSVGYRGITIAADDVALDLNGFTLGGIPGTLDGVWVSGVRDNVTVRNGIVRGWGGVAANATNAANVTFRDLIASGNLGGGLFSGISSRAERCQSIHNGNPPGPGPVVLDEHGHGFWLENGSVISECISWRNNHHAVRAQSGSTVRQTVMRECGHDGLHGSHSMVVQGSVAAYCSEGIEVDSGSTVSDSVGARSFEDGIRTKKAENDQLFGGSVVQGCTAYANGDDGFDMRATGNRLISSVSFSNLKHGVRLENMTVVFGNLVTISDSDDDPDNNAGNDGIKINGKANRIEANHVVFNYGDGLQTDTSADTGNFIVRNSAAVNDASDYDIGADNHFTEVNPSSGFPKTNAWSNLDY